LGYLSTIGINEIIYGSHYMAGGMKSPVSNILEFSGINTIQESSIGNVGSIGDAGRKQ
jgi:hypothetical protein